MSLLERVSGSWCGSARLRLALRCIGWEDSGDDPAGCVLCYLGDAALVGIM